MNRLNEIWVSYVIEVREFLLKSRRKISKLLGKVIAEESLNRKWKLPKRKCQIYKKIAESFLEERIWGYELASRNFKIEGMKAEEYYQFSAEINGYQIDQEYEEIKSDISSLLSFKSNEEIVEYIIKKYAVFPCSSILAGNPTFNQLPDYALAKAIRFAVNEKFKNSLLIS